VVKTNYQGLHVLLLDFWCSDFRLSTVRVETANQLYPTEFSASFKIPLGGLIRSLVLEMKL